MRTEKIIPFNRKNGIHNSDGKNYSYTEVMVPGQPVNIAPWITTEIAYDLIDGMYQTRFKFWYGKHRTKDYHLDSNNQIDMRHSCKRIITLQSTKFTELKPRPIQSLIEIEMVSHS